MTKSADGTEDWQERASDSTNESGSLSVGTCASDSSTISRVVEAWSLGAYRSTVDGSLVAGPQPTTSWSASRALASSKQATEWAITSKACRMEALAPTRQLRGTRTTKTCESERRKKGERRNIDKSISSTRPVPPQMNGAFTPRGHEGLPPGTPTVNLDEGQEMKTSRILIRFATLLRKLDWGLAASFRTILIHMARHEARAVEAAEALPEAMASQTNGQLILPNCCTLVTRDFLYQTESNRMSFAIRSLTCLNQRRLDARAISSSLSSDFERLLSRAEKSSARRRVHR